MATLFTFGDEDVAVQAAVFLEELQSHTLQCILFRLVEWGNCHILKFDKSSGCWLPATQWLCKQKYIKK